MKLFHRFPKHILIDIKKKYFWKRFESEIMWLIHKIKL